MGLGCGGKNIPDDSGFKNRWFQKEADSDRGLRRMASGLVSSVSKPLQGASSFPSSHSLTPKPQLQTSYAGSTLTRERNTGLCLVINKSLGPSFPCDLTSEGTGTDGLDSGTRRGVLSPGHWMEIQTVLNQKQ